MRSMKGAARTQAKKRLRKKVKGFVGGRRKMFRTAKELEMSLPYMELLGEFGCRNELLDIDAARQLEPALSGETSFHSAQYHSEFSLLRSDEG